MGSADGRNVLQKFSGQVMAKRLVIGIEWFGPFSRDEATHASDNFAEGLYMAIGQPAGPGRHKRRLQYIGISQDICRRIKNKHEKLDQLNQKKLTLWLGEIATAEPSGKHLRATPKTLAYAEWLHAYFMDIPLNERKKEYLPPMPVTVLNRWWRTDFETSWFNHPRPEWPDLIDFAGLEHRARKVWFRAPNQTIIRPSEF